MEAVPPASGGKDVSVAVPLRLGEGPDGGDLAQSAGDPSEVLPPPLAGEDRGGGFGCRQFRAPLLASPASGGRDVMVAVPLRSGE